MKANIICKSIRRLFLVLTIMISLSSCSDNKSFVVVVESEFGDWQWEVEEITKILQDMDLPYTDNKEVSDIFNEIESIRERMERLDKHIHKNFLHSDEIGSRGLPTRYAD